MSTKYLGAEGFRWFVGVVADIKDPQQLGRVKVRVFGIHDNTNDISDDDLPWAQLLMSPTSASLSGVGYSPTGIAPDSYVVGFFADGMEAQFPIIMGTFHKMPDMDPNKSDVNTLARGTNKLEKQLTGPEPASAYKAQYPKNQVFESKTGHIIEIDDTDGDERIHIYHRKGTYVEINKDGRIVIKSVDSAIDVTDKDKTIYAKGDITIESEKNITLKAADTISLTAKTVNIAGGSSTMKLVSGAVGVESGNVRLKGDYVKVDSPLSSVSGANISSGKVSAQAVAAGKVNASSVKAKTTAGLASAVAGMADKLKHLPDLTGMTLPDLQSALNDSLGGLKQTLAENVTSIADSTGIKVGDISGQVTGAVSKLETLSSNLDTKFDSLISGKVASINNLVDSEVSDTLESISGAFG